jgi:hypothetical protein
MFGYNGPTDQRSIDQFLASNPAAAARMGKYQETMKQMVSGQPIRGFQVGGVVSEPETPAVDPNLQQLQQGQQQLALQAGQPLQAAPVSQMDATSGLLTPGVGQITTPFPTPEVKTVEETGAAAAPTPTPASLIDAATAAPQVTEAVSGLQAAQGEVSQVIAPQTFDPQNLSQLGLTAPQIEQARQIADIPDLGLTQDQLVQAATLASTGLSLPQAIAQTTGRDFTTVAAEFEGKTPEAVAQDVYNLTPTQAATVQRTQVEEAAKAAEIPTAQEAQSQFQSDIQSVQGQVGANDLVRATDILAAEQAVSAVAATVESLSEAATMNAAQGTLSQAALAQAAQGTVTAESTIQGQMSKLMQQFNDGTPAWAAGAMRAANAAMAARGLGASSMAGAAIVQAAMEAATPIAAQDAQIFAQMNLTNLNNKQQAALANAAANQNMEMRNLDFRQQAALQNSTNAFALQGQNLSNTQQVVLANAQFKAALQNQSLDIKTQTALTNAARYAEMNNLNLTREQQTRLQNSAQNLQVDMANLSSSQQTALANLQVRAALRGQELSNEQQMAVLSSTQAFEAAGLDATNQQQAFMQDAAAQAALEGRALDARQQTSLFNVSAQLREREIELTNEQQSRLFNTTNALNIEVQNLSNRQQTALANAQIDAAIRGQELSNTQQANVVNAARIGEIANINFTAEQQKAVENARLAQTVDIENLNASQAKLLSDAAAMSAIDTTNLNFRQQAEVQNAQNFLQLDLANLSNEQQTSLFKTQQITQSLFSDQAAQNAAAQFNASSENQTEQFFQGLVSQVSQFNTSQINAMRQFNAGQENAMGQFSADLEQRRDLFNAQNALIIEQANAQWRQNVTTLNTAAQNDSNMEFNKTLNALSSAALAQVWQRERDMMNFAFTAEQSGLDRQLSIILGDKQLEEVRKQIADKDETFKFAFAMDLLFGSTGGSSGGFFGR